jgi:hypothetical protein
MTDVYKMKIKIGDSEFEAEGPAEKVKEQFDRFMDVVVAVKNAPPAEPQKPIVITPSAGSLGIDGVAPSVQATVDEELLNRVFQRGADSVSLLALPRTESSEADALVALLYGFSRLMSKNQVSSIRLMQAARQSGVNLVRLDSILNSRTDLVLAAGVRRGRKYSLNNRGLAYAEDLVRRMVE